MVKVGRRFFFNQAHVKKHRIITIISIFVVIIIILVAFFSTNYFYDKSNEKPIAKVALKEFVEVEIFNQMPSILSYFQVLENVNISDIAISYDDDFTFEEDLSACTEEEIDIINKIRNQEMNVDNNVDYFKCLNFIPNKIGYFKVNFEIGNKKLQTQLHVIDTQAPALTVKNVNITNEESYYANDFMASCTDNSKQECYIEFYNPKRGQRVDYSNYKNPGTYEIKIIAKDSSGNETEPQTATLTIKEVKYYTVSFNSNGGSAVDSQRVREGEKAYSSYSERSGYYFDGWLLGKNKFNFETPITSDITLTASWKKVSTGGGGSSSGGSGGSSGGSGGGSSTDKCKYGTYNDTYSDISMSATLINGKKMSDCADINDGTSDEEFIALKSIASNIITKVTGEGGKLNEEARYYYGENIDFQFNASIGGISTDKGGFAGIYIKITLKNARTGAVLDTYEAYNCSRNDCSFY